MRFSIINIPVGTRICPWIRLGELTFQEKLDVSNLSFGPPARFIPLYYL
jgi:hypothetical protein